MRLAGYIVLNREKVLDAALRKGWTQRELSKSSKVSMTTLYKLLRGVPVGVRTANKIAAAIGVSYRSILESTRVSNAAECSAQEPQARRRAAV